MTDQLDLDREQRESAEARYTVELSQADLTADGHMPDELTVHSEEWMGELWFTGIEPRFITHQRGDKLTLWISGNVIRFKEYDIPSIPR